jgi:hypothetical protein
VRLPFPERVPLLPVFGFCAALNMLQLFNGTTPLFSVLTTLFILIVTVAFNTAGGLTRPSGGYIFAYSILVVILGITYKALLGEPGQRNLLQPTLTLEVYVGSALALLIATFVARKFTLQKSLFPTFPSLTDMGRASIGCFFVGAASQLYGIFSSAGIQTGSILSALNQLNYFLPLAMILGTTYEIRKSGGQRSINAHVFLSGFVIFAGGIIGYSKQGLLEPFACWIFAVAAQRYKITVAQFFGLLLTAILVVYYLIPYTQIGRNAGEGIGRNAGEGTTNFSESIKVNIFLLSNLDLVRAAYNLDEQRYNESNSIMLRYYDRPQGLADRLQMIAPDDILINATETTGSFGIFPLVFAFENNIPHFLWAGKPIVNFGNLYAREIGIIDRSDTTTGISFSPAGDMYHQARWGGILGLLPALLFVLFVVTDSCCGDTRSSPFALLAFILFLHSAPEAGATGIIHAMTFDIGVLLLVAVVSTKMMPFIAGLVLGRVKSEPGAEPIIQAPTTAFAAAVPGMPSSEIPPSTYRWSRPDSR